ncbi:MAG: polyprenyl synthetase family protein [Pseudomonadota bacterium]
MSEEILSVSLATPSQPQPHASADAEFASAVARLRAMTADDLDAVNREILSRMDSAVSLIPDIAGHLVNAGGKRIRPMLTLAAARVFDFDGDDHVKLAAAVELIHGATLLHDDVVDGSALRRGARTANIIWGNKESVLVGDFIFSRAFELMVAAKSLPVLQVLSRASGVIAEGEVLQLTTQKNIETTFETYIEVVEAKTAALFAGAAHAGAIIAGAAQNEEFALRDYGRYFGVAYQLIDDALDYAGAEGDLGKTVGDDFREGKMTLPVVYAISRARDEEKSFWRRVIAEGRQAEGDLEQARFFMERDNAIADTVACARRYSDRALAELAKAPRNDYADALSDLVATSAARIS